ncbi:MAG: hypothetical protein K0R49_821 [Burkholderiales bacterium]|nr:hypothetical protein [Burkholderiales bacterium]
MNNANRLLFLYPTIFYIFTGIANAYDYEITTCSNIDNSVNISWNIDMGSINSVINVSINRDNRKENFIPDTITTNFYSLSSKPPFYITRIWSGKFSSPDRKSGEELTYIGQATESNQSNWSFKIYANNVVRTEIALECQTKYATKGLDRSNSLPWDSLDKLLTGVADFLKNDIQTDNILTQHSSSTSYSQLYGRCYDESASNLVFWWDLTDNKMKIGIDGKKIDDIKFSFLLDEHHHVTTIFNKNVHNLEYYTAVYKASAIFNPALEFWKITDKRKPGHTISKIIQCKTGELSDVVNANNKRPRSG